MIPKRAPGAGPDAASVPDETIAIPIRLTPQGAFVRSGPWDSLHALIGVMFMTSRSALPHAPWFGLYELVSQPDPWGSDIAEALNLAFAELGVLWTRVDSVQEPSGDDRAQGKYHFHIRFKTIDGQFAETDLLPAQ